MKIAKSLITSVMLACVCSSAFSNSLSKIESRAAVDKPRVALASLFLLLLDSSDDERSDNVIFDFDPASAVLAEVVQKNGNRILLTGTKTADSVISTVSGLRVSSSNNPRDFLTLEIDDQGRPLIAETILGKMVYEYPSSGIVVVTSTNLLGESETLEFDISGSQKTRTLISSAKVSSCSLGDAYNWQRKSGDIVFGCDNAFTEDSDDTNSIYRTPKNLKVYFRPDEVESQNSEYRGEASLFIDISNPDSHPELSQHVYNYSVNIPDGFPTYEEWESCCTTYQNKMVLSFEVASYIHSWMKVGDDAEEAAACFAAAFVLTGGSTTPACVTILMSNALKKALEEAIKAIIKSDLINGICQNERYEEQVISGRERSTYNDVNVEIEKTNVAGGMARYEQNGLDFLSEARLPKIEIGPVPAKLNISLLSDGIDGITAYTEDNIELQDSDVLGQLVNVDNGSFSTGTTLKFRAFDQFYDRSKPNAQTLSNRRENQYYGCANYTWTLKRNGDTVEERVQQPHEKEVSVILEDAGEYEIVLDIDNSPGFTDRVQTEWIDEAGDFVSDLPAASSSLRFTVEELDNCAIERYQLRIADARPDYENATTMRVLLPGEALAVENGQGLLVGLTREGVQIATLYGFFTDHYFPTVERSSADVDFGERLVRINDGQNNCSISFPLNLTIKNSAYRKFVGKTYTFTSSFAGTEIVTFEADGSISGSSVGSYEFLPQVFSPHLSCPDRTEIKTLGAVRIYAGVSIPSRLYIGENTITPQACSHQVE